MLMKNTASFRPSACVPVMHVAFIAAGKCWEFGTRGLNGRHKDALLSVQSSVSKKTKTSLGAGPVQSLQIGWWCRYRLCRAKGGFKEMLKPAGAWFVPFGGLNCAKCFVTRGIKDTHGHCLCGWWRSSCSHNRSSSKAQDALTGSVTPYAALLNVFLSAEVLRTSRCVSVPCSST